jgi:hypothetical protein
LFRVVLQECPPRLRWRLRKADHVFAYRRFRDLDSKSQSSLWILGAHHTLSRLRARISSRISCGTHGRPGRPC